MPSLLPGPRWALTPPFHHRRSRTPRRSCSAFALLFFNETCRLSAASPGAQHLGRLLSVPLSIASRRPAVSRHPALRSPDFPLRDRNHHAATAQPASRAHRILVGESPGALIFSWSPNFWLRHNLKVSLRRNRLRRLSLRDRYHHAATAQRERALPARRRTRILGSIALQVRLEPDAPPQDAGLTSLSASPICR